MSKSYVLERLVKDPSVKKALHIALSDDGKLSYSEVKKIVFSTLDCKGVTYQEFKDLQLIMKEAKTLDDQSRQYIKTFLDKHYGSYLKAQARKKAFTLPYTKDHIPKTTSNNRRPGKALTPIYLTIHSTANPRSSAENERKWLTNNTNTRTASFHIVVDEKMAIECIPLNEIAWHAGDKSGNEKSISLEICESGDRTVTLRNAVSLTAKILRDRHWGLSKLRIHKDWSGKICPRILINNGDREKHHQSWDWFVDEVADIL